MPISGSKRANPPGVLDLVPIQRVGHVNPQADETAAHLHNIHAHVHLTIQASNAQHKLCADRHHRQVLFDAGDWVWAVLTRDHFPAGEYKKLRERKIGPCEVLKKNDNAYRLRLPDH